jgi:hypothetical protein
MQHMTESCLMFFTGIAAIVVGAVMHDAAGGAIVFFGAILAVSAFYREADER